YPSVEAVASAGRGITETFKLISKLTFVDLLRRFQGRKPEEGAPHPGPLPPGEGEAAATTTSPTLILVTPPKAPGATPPEAASPGKSSQDARKGKPAVEPAGKAGADRIAAMEARLAAVESALAVESEERRRISTRLDELVSAANNRIAAGEADR